jgi:hypothetical protein
MNKLDEIRQLDPAFADVIDLVIDIMLSKSHDYSDNGNLFATVANSAEQVGTTFDLGFEFMIAMKTSRIHVLRRKNHCNNESLVDSMIDRIAYAIGQCALARQGAEVV